MTQTRHTAAPWTISCNGIWANSPWNARVKIAEVISHASMNGIDQAANARLIAAAPEMLDALTSIVDALELAADYGFATELQTVRAAIAKATA